VLVVALLIARIVRFNRRFEICSVAEDCGRNVCYGRFPRMENLRVGDSDYASMGLQLEGLNSLS
jgi:hypothetical protein